MGDNNEEIGKNPKIDSQSEKFEILEKLNSQEQKFDEFAKKLQSIEESVSKIPKFDDDERKTMMKFEKQLESLEKTMLLNVTFTENNSLELISVPESKQEGAEIRKKIRVETCVQKCDKFRRRSAKYQRRRRAFQSQSKLNAKKAVILKLLLFVSRMLRSEMNDAQTVRKPRIQTEMAKKLKENVLPFLLHKLLSSLRIWV
ncbi:Protein CBG24322 [Caenorhabditis briggsae]|uniref:Protein CBG24322 n=1 Tax=Caenorhabditis briggsae TaxID=6238 RepID=A8WKG5_CAEBR|nr:Protein CBG24322 [Caenorhabditis briggsae]CAP20960.2 Protein CBG24322 [Caenorhabditis briggsae]